MSSNLAQKICIPCRGGIPPLSPQESERLCSELESWDVVSGHHLSRTYYFPDFKSSLEFVNKIGKLAEKENHHPEIYLAWDSVRINLWTQKVNGLTESDFILAAKIDLL